MKVFFKTDSIKRILIRKNKSQNWLASKIKVSSGYMSQLMEGTRNPSPQVRERLMKAMKVSNFDDLFQIQDEER